MVNQEDRKSVERLHPTHQQQSGPSSSRANMSVQVIPNTAKPGGIGWKKEPTAIPIPSNDQARQARKSVGGSIFTRANMTSGSKRAPGRESSGNPTARQTDFTNYGRNKRFKQTHEEAGGRRVAARGNPQYTSKPRIAPEFEESTDIDGGMTHSDPLNIDGDGSGSIIDMEDQPFLILGDKGKQREQTPARSKRTKPVIADDLDDSDEVEILPHPPPQSTKSAPPTSSRGRASVNGRITSPHGRSRRGTSSPIEEFTPPPRAQQKLPSPKKRKTVNTSNTTSEIPQGMVKNIVKKLNHQQDSDSTSNGPRIDLRSTLKNGMKAKSQPSKKEEIKMFTHTPAPVDVLSASTLQPPKTVTPKTTSHYWSSTDRCSLPLSRFYFGCRRLDAVDGWVVTWSPGDKMVVKAGELAAFEEYYFKVREEIGYACYLPLLEVEEDAKEIIMKLETDDTGRRFPGAETYFTMGDTNGGSLVFCFDRMHSDWDATLYEEFIEWLKRKINGSVDIMGTTGCAAALSKAESKHEYWASRYATEPNAPSKPRPRPLKRARSGDETLDERSPPAGQQTLEESLSRGVSHSRQHSRATTEEGSGSEVALRRSGRIRPTPVRKSPPPNLDEVILCYPQGIPGAINITVGDVVRLEPSEYLNDTLIEFGLKLWLHRLEKMNPELANQIHVFSSFFYKKLNRKNFEEGYESVKKWTAKVDIFSKKYIVVPINENLHWYLAIIYHPEHVLLPPPPPVAKEPKTRARKSLAVADPPAEVQDASPSSAQPDQGSAGEATPPAIQPPDSVEELTAATTETLVPISPLPAAEPSPESHETGVTQHPPPVAPDNHSETPHGSEAADEASVTNLLIFPSGCRAEIISNVSSESGSPMPDQQEPEQVDKDDSSQGITRPVSRDVEMDVDQPVAISDDIRAVSPTISDMGTKLSPPRAASPDIEMQDRHSAEPMDIDTLSEGEREGAATGVPPTQFYSSRTKQASNGRKGNHPPIVLTDEESPQVKEESELEDDIATSETRTYIFTMDSLGSRHPQAIKQLSKYLQFEAADKRRIEESSPAVGKQAFVPAQPNFCDCGLYLLHFTETFMTDPDKYAAIIKRPKTSIPAEERKRVWHDTKPAGMRESLRTEIMTLATEWKAAKEKAKAKAEGGEAAVETIQSSDDEVDIVATNMPPTPVNGKGGKGKAAPSVPVRGKAARLRG